MNYIIVELAATPDEPCCEQTQATLAGKSNLVDFQNVVPIARELLVLNKTERDGKVLRPTVSSKPAFSKSKSWTSDYLGAAQTVRVSDLDLSLEGALVGRLTEIVSRTRNNAARGD
jgi:hypothetical protein